MTTIQDRIIEIIKKHNNEVMSFPTPRELLNANKRLEQFLLTSIKEVEEETRKEVVENIKDYAVNNTIAYGDGNVIKWWPNGLWKDIERLSITNKEKQ